MHKEKTAYHAHAVPRNSTQDWMLINPFKKSIPLELNEEMYTLRYSRFLDKFPITRDRLIEDVRQMAQNDPHVRDYFIERYLTREDIRMRSNTSEPARR